MKRLIAFLLLINIPNLCFGLDDACTKPSEYTADKRCYVTPEQKQQEPFNAVVALIDEDGFRYCTGTIVKGKDNSFYLYTAKHCTDINKNGMSDHELLISLQDGTQRSVYIDVFGDYNIERDDNHGGDFAIYKLNGDYYPYALITDKKHTIGFGPFASNYDALVVGYGSLKIMSDKEIEDFKQRYIEFLKNNKGIKVEGTETLYGFSHGGINSLNTKVKEFIDYYLDPSYWRDLFADYELKVSKCKYSSNGKETNCQKWSGNSGGPIFDKDGNLMGIMTRGNRIIGGSRHAGAENERFDLTKSSINLIQEQIIPKDEKWRK